MAGKPGESNESRSEASRAGTRGSASAGRSGNAGGVSTRTYKDPQAGGLVTGYGAPVHTEMFGPAAGTQMAAGPALTNQNNMRRDTYNKAAAAWNESARQRSLANFANAMAPMGLSMEPPDIKRPATFSGGDYHLGWNPGSFAGGLLGGMAFPGGGIPGGFAGGALYDATGLGNVMLGGPGKMGMKNFDAPEGGYQGQGAAPGGGFSNTGGGAEHLQGLASLNQGVSGNPGAPQSIGTGPATPTGPNYTDIMASLQQVTPSYGVSLPGYKYKKATV